LYRLSGLFIGATGFVGAWILKFLLEKGFSVRAAVRSEAKANYLRDLFKDHANKLEFTFVKDVTIPGVFDEAVKDVDGIIHSASPLTNSDPTIDPQELIAPAVQGSVGMLKSAKNSPSVKRVVITSSASTLASVVSPPPAPYEFTEVSIFTTLS
jgi:nucleoside-diphosphate-sugar epimerase